MTENQTEVTNPQKALGCYKVGILFTAILFTITGVLMLMQGNFFHTAVLILWAVLSVFWASYFGLLKSKIWAFPVSFAVFAILWLFW